ncbi:MAG: TerB family tellurite resistance protein [Bdellovibrionales bacterium]|nr:TerB family tellurite resistance protein [Bdellovibrionales bacterium]
MFQNLRDFFKGQSSLEITKDGILADEHLQLAVAAVLYEVMTADDMPLAEEGEKIHKLLMKKFGLDDSKADILSLLAMETSTRERLPEFIAAIRENFSEDQRREVLRLAKEVALVDGEIDLGEAVTADVLAHKLGLD